MKELMGKMTEADFGNLMCSYVAEQMPKALAVWRSTGGDPITLERQDVWCDGKGWVCRYEDGVTLNTVIEHDPHEEVVSRRYRIVWHMDANQYGTAQSNTSDYGPVLSDARLTS